MKMNLESKMKQDIAMNKKENIDLKNKQENIQEDPELPLQRDKKSYTISMHNPSILQKLQTITKKNAQIAKKKILNKLDLLNDDPYNFNEKDFIRRRYDKDNVDNGKKFFKLRFLKSKLDSLDSNENNINNNNTKSDDSQSNVEKERCLRQYNSDFILTLEKSILSFNVKNYKDSYEILLNSRIIRNIKEYGEFLLVVGGFDKFLIGEFIAKQKYPNDKDSILFDLENNEQLKDYEKSLFGVKTNSKNNKDFVWLLLKENKNIALDEILYKNYDFFLISTESFSEETIAYFLFLKKI